MNKLIVILGPTASGKTGLSVKLAKKFSGEVVSADSRQVFRSMNLGTGKVTKKEKQGIKHHLIDVASPKTNYSVAKYQQQAYLAIDEIIEKGKIPFLVGGSPFYLYAVIDGLSFPKMKADEKLRKKLESKTPEQLLKMLQKIAPQRAKNIEVKNKRRLVRAVEIANNFGYMPELEKKPKYDCLILGVKKSREELRNLIHSRLLKRMGAGMAKEVEKLHQAGVSWKRLDDFGLEYRWIAKYLQGKINKREMLVKLETDINRFSKHQMTWFQKDQRIIWISKEKEAKGLIDNFLDDKRKS